MTENQKLREAFESRMTDNGKWPRAVEQGRNGCYLLAQTENAWAEWQACAGALALPTADHLPDVGEMVVDHFPDATKMIETAAPVGELPELPEPDPMADRWLSSHIYTADQMRAYARAALSAGDAGDEPQSTPIACAVHVAGRTFEKGVPFCDVIDYIESNTTRWVASSDRYPPEGERVFFMDLATDIVGFDMWAGEGFIWMPSHWMPIPPAPAMRKDKP